MTTRAGADAETAATTRAARAAAPFSLAGLSSATPPATAAARPACSSEIVPAIPASSRLAPPRGPERLVGEGRTLQARPARQRPAVNAHLEDGGISPDDLRQPVKDSGP